MSQVPFIPFVPENAPFSAEQRHWLNGYLAGYFSNAAGSAPMSAPAIAKRPLLILFGSQTGSAEGLAKKAKKLAESKAFEPRLLCMEKAGAADFAAVENVLVITSTYGDGEPPDNAQAFWSWLSSDAAPRLDGTRFSVLALGDTQHPQFCEFGKQCDARLEQLGATRIHPRTDCDVDYEVPAAAWMECVLNTLGGERAGVDQVPTALPQEANSSASAEWSRKNPFPARLSVNRELTRPGSAKEVRHLEIALGESGLEYEVGDALGVMPSNCPALVSDFLDAVGCDGEEAIECGDADEMPLRLALLQHFDITKPSSDLLQEAARLAPDSELARLIDPARRDELKAFLWGREVIDIIAPLRRRFSPGELAPLLKKLQPRLYSISSSLKLHAREVHLTVGVVRHNSHGRARKGVCSSFLADRCGQETPVPVWIQKSHGFRLPSDASRPIVMVGPGTGIAPFRAFLEERLVIGAPGKNWLFFGDQRRSTDFLYQEALEGWLTSGHLTKLDLAFSRDQSEKVYVQHRMLEAANDLWAWLEAGAHFYVCGDGSRMARDVDAALHRVVEIAGGLSSDAAKEYVSGMKSEKRYQRDVY